VGPSNRTPPKHWSYAPGKEIIFRQQNLSNPHPAQLSLAPSLAQPYLKLQPFPHRLLVGPHKRLVLRVLLSLRRKSNPTQKCTPALTRQPSSI
jgi:hypothetical protein